MKHTDNILFPTNVLGKYMQSFAMLIGYPYTDRELEISWTGERLEVVYASVYHTQGQAPCYVDTRLSYKNGFNTTETITVRQSDEGQTHIFVSDVYFRCFNCSQLVVNGVVYIYNGKIPDPAYIDYYADQFQPILGVHNPTVPDQSLPEVPNILTYYANKFKAIFGVDL